MTFKNRVLLSPMMSVIGQDGNGLVADAGLDFFTDFAKGGFASACASVEIPADSGHLRSLVVDNEQMASFQDVHKIHRMVHAYDMKMMCEITHPGCNMTPAPGRVPMSASAMTWNGHEVKEMDKDDMEMVADMYAKEAFYVKRAGFDCINLHFAHGWLISNFLSPLSNHRKDEFGGSVENRCRFPLMVLERVRKMIGDMPIELRLNGSDGMPGGITTEDCIEQVKIFQDVVDFIHITCGNRLDALSRPLMHPTHFVPVAHNAAVSEAVKKAGVKIPIGVVGSIHTPELAEQLLAEGKADYILMARGAIADNQWVNKVKEGHEEDIRPCLRCDYCLDAGRRGALTKNLTFASDATYDQYCSVNPYYAQGVVKKNIPMPEKSKKVAIVGGGVAGMVAAITAADRGHEVVLFEKENRLGGVLNTFCHTLSFKKEIERYNDYLARQVGKRSIEVKLNTVATPEMIDQMDVDAAIIAIGSKEAKPKMAGVDGDNVMMALDVFDHEDQVGNNVVIIGGGTVGCELSIHLGSMGRKVTVLELGEFLAANAQLSERMHIEKFMVENGVKSHINTTCTEITQEGVKAKDEKGNDVFYPADTVIISVGMRPLTEERDAFADVAFDVRYIGDCNKVADIRMAMNGGFDAAATL